MEVSDGVLQQMWQADGLRNGLAGDEAMTGLEFHQMAPPVMWHLDSGMLLRASAITGK